MVFTKWPRRRFYKAGLDEGDEAKQSFSLMVLMIELELSHAAMLRSYNLQDPLLQNLNIFSHAHPLLARESHHMNARQAKYYWILDLTC